MATLILAGGRSSRMGRDKALIPIHGTPMIRRVYDVADQCHPPVYVISPWGDRYRPVLPDACRFIHEENGPGFSRADRPGPLVGFYSGFRHILEEPSGDGNAWILLLACDLPKLQPGIIRTWQAQLTTASGSTIAALPTHPTKGWHPLCGFYHPRGLSSLADFLASGGRSFQQWLCPSTSEQGSGRIQPLSCPDTTLLFNCNSPEDLATVMTEASSF
ncbi:MAG: molybdenum cofactor guanylyltransferase [Leptolyngbyaceae cyanobacterium]